MLKACSKCGETKEITAEYWHRHKKQPDGFARWCKDCANNFYRDQRQAGQMPKGLIQVEKDLPMQGIPKVNMQLGHKYKFDGWGKHGDQTFKGEVVAINDRHITLRHYKHGFAETFLKWDLANTNVKEV